MFQVVVGLGIVLVFVGACGYRWQMLVDEVALKTQIKESKTKELDALKKKVQEVEDYEKNKRLLEDKNRIIEQLRKNQGGPVRLLDYLSQSLDPLKIWLTTVDGDAQVAINGKALTNDDIVQFIRNLKQLNAELQRQLSKNQEYLPPEEEAVTLLKQLSDLGIRIGLDLKLWRPGARAEDSSKLFVRLPVDVEMSGGYHTLALFFDRIGKLPRIINVNKIKMGGGKEERGRVSVQTSFQLTAFASPAASTAPGGGKPAGK